MTQQRKESRQLTWPYQLAQLTAAPAASPFCSNTSWWQGMVQKELVGKPPVGDLSWIAAAICPLWSRVLWSLPKAALLIYLCTVVKDRQKPCQKALAAPTQFLASFQEKTSLKGAQSSAALQHWGVLVTEGVTQHFISIGIFLNSFLKQFFKVICSCKFGQSIRKTDPIFSRNSCEQSNKGN